MMTDPIADMLTRIRNAIMADHDNVSVPTSNTKREIARILREEGYIAAVAEAEEGHKAELQIELKYLGEREPVIEGLQRVSSPGRRVYCGKEDLPRVLNGLGVAIMSTSRGLMTDRQCREQGIGGEYLCKVW